MRRAAVPSSSLAELVESVFLSVIYKDRADYWLKVDVIRGHVPFVWRIKAHLMFIWLLGFQKVQANLLFCN